DEQDPMVKNAIWTSGERTWAVKERSAKEWDEVAKQYLEAEQWAATIASSTHAIRRDPSVLSYRIKRGAGHLGFGNYPSAIHDLHIALYHKSAGNQEIFLILNLLGPLITRIEDCEKLEEQQANGVYDWDEVCRQVATDEDPVFADFIGPVGIEEMPHRGGGRGVVATRDIAPGELLVSM
ncbi:659_t:CDS:2, partial [Acaulospora colombiana]